MSASCEEAVVNTSFPASLDCSPVFYFNCKGRNIRLDFEYYKRNPQYGCLVGNDSRCFANEICTFYGSPVKGWTTVRNESTSSVPSLSLTPSQ